MTGPTAGIPAHVLANFDQENTAISRDLDKLIGAYRDDRTDAGPDIAQAAMYAAMTVLTCGQKRCLLSSAVRRLAELSDGGEVR